MTNGFPMPQNIRVMTDGGDQIIHIPAEYRLDTDQVQVFRNEQGDLVLRPIRASRGTALMQALAAFRDVDRSFFEAALAHRSEQLPMWDRPGP
jgi:antitoxin VapB